MRIAKQQEKLIEVLREARRLLALRENDYAWSSWQDADAALREIDSLISRIEAGDVPPRSDIEVLILPTGPIQEVSLSSGWGEQFLTLANQADHAVAKAYGPNIEAHKAELAGQMEQMFGGRLRWFCLIFLGLSVAFAACLSRSEEPVEVYFPIHLKGDALRSAIVGAAAVFGVLGAINWYSWLKQPRKK